jgi:hypothetical protein
MISLTLTLTLTLTLISSAARRGARPKPLPSSSYANLDQGKSCATKAKTAAIGGKSKCIYVLNDDQLG